MERMNRRDPSLLNADGIPRSCHQEIPENLISTCLRAIGKLLHRFFPQCGGVGRRPETWGSEWGLVHSEEKATRLQSFDEAFHHSLEVKKVVQDRSKTDSVKFRHFA